MASARIAPDCVCTGWDAFLAKNQPECYTTLKQTFVHSDCMYSVHRKLFEPIVDGDATLD